MSEARGGWHRLPEAGSVIGLRGIALWVKLLGRGPARLLVGVLAVYYFIFWSAPRRHSRDYLRRVGVPHGPRQVLRHLWVFGVTMVDRLLFVQDRFEHFEIERHGHEHLQEQLATGSGAILLGAHLGSFEVMRTQSHHFRVPLNVVGEFSNAQMLNGILNRLNPDIDARLIPAKPGGLELALQIRDAISRGEFVAILGDRIFEDTPSVEVEFLGGTIRLPTGPYEFASVLRCPIYFTTALHTEPNRYTLHCEPFAQQVQLPRKARKEALAAYAQAYADRMAHYCRLSPYNWFNFFDFWSTREPVETPALPPA